MSVVSGVGQVSFGLRPWPEVGPGAAPIGVPDLVRLLDSLQKAVFTAAAHQLRLPGTRNLSADQRRHHTLALLGLRAGDLVFELAPLSAFEQTGAPTLFSAADLAQVARDSARPVVTTVGAAVDALAAHFTQSTDRLQKSDLISRYAVAIAATAINLRHTIEITVTEQSGALHTLHADEPSSLRVLALEAVDHGDLQLFTGCVVRDILTSQSALYAEIPTYDDALVRCEYADEAESDITWHIRPGDSISILGTPYWPHRAQQADDPDTIKIASILTKDGDLVGHTVLRHLLRGIADDLLTP